MQNIEILEKLFGSGEKVKIMRLFLFNPNNAFDIADIEDRAKVTRNDAKREVALLEKIGLIKKRIFHKDDFKNVGHKIKTSGWILDDTFYYLTPLQNFLIHINPMRHQEIVEKLSRVGKLKLVIVAGLFIQQPESRIDMLIVGDNLRNNSLENVIKGIEAEIGKELRYSYFETTDFQYRLGMCDKLIRDILDYPHEKILDRLGIE